MLANLRGLTPQRLTRALTSTLVRAAVAVGFMSSMRWHPPLSPLLRRAGEGMRLMTNQERMMDRRIAAFVQALSFGMVLTAWLGAARAEDSVRDVVQLQMSAQRLQRLPAPASGTWLAGRVSQEGHWTFVNATGETFTAANDGEVKRAFEILLPALGAGRANVVLTADSIFERAKLLAQLPKAVDLSIGWGDEPLKLISSTTGSSTTGGPVKYLAELKPNLLIELTNEKAFAEALQLLRQPLDRQAFRVLSIEAGGPHMFSATPRVDRATGRADSDTIDPGFVLPALSALRGQTAVLVGRLAGDDLVMKPASGPARRVSWSALQAAATASDVGVLVLKSASAQQPGGRNWLWQRVEVRGLETALGHATLADFFDALGSPSNRLVLSADQASAGRISLNVWQFGTLSSLASATGTLGTALADVVAGLAGNVVHQGAVANFVSTERRRELDRRLLPFIPSAIQFLYGGLLLLGSVGIPTSWRWWRRVWPAEIAHDYPNSFGFVAAQAVRTLLYGLIFMPSVALAAAPVTLWTVLRRAGGLRRGAAQQQL